MFILDNAEKLPKESSSYSELGKKAHNAAAVGFLVGMEAMEEACEGDLEMAMYVKKYILWVEERKKPDDDIYYESELPNAVSPGSRCYVDVALVGSKRMVIVDLKYGEGIFVMARGNTQMAMYGMSLLAIFMSVYDFEDDYLITMVIYQPRCSRSKGDPFSLWNITVGEFRQFVKFIIKIAEDIKARKDLVFLSSEDNCRFCRAAVICRANAERLFGNDEDILPAKPKPLEAIYLQDPGSLDPDTLTFILKNKAAIEGWLDKLAKYRNAALNAGQPELLGNNWKLVPGVDGNRTYVNEKRVKKFLMEHLPAEIVLPPSKLISPAQAEKQLETLYGKDIAKELINEHVKRAPGAPRAALATDPRDAVVDDATGGFKNLDLNLL